MTDINLEKLVFFDLETTGLDADCRIVQIALIRGEKIFQSLVNPGIPIPPESTEIHHITDADVADKPRFGEVVDEVLAFMEGSILAGFNIRKFDIPVLKRECAAVDRVLPVYPILDLFELNQKMNPRTLAWFHEHYTGKPMDAAEAHDAVYDCICTRNGFLGMYDKHENLPTDLDELSSFAEPERLPVAGCDWLVWIPQQSEPAFARGKYRGFALSEVGRKEPSYLRWLLNIDADPITKNIVNLFKSNQDQYIDFLKTEHPMRLEPKYMEYRHAMDRGKNARCDELVQLADTTGDPALVFLAAAWAAKLERDDAVKLAETYLTLKDPNAGADRRSNYLRKVLDLDL